MCDIQTMHNSFDICSGGEIMTWILLTQVAAPGGIGCTDTPYVSTNPHFMGLGHIDVLPSVHPSVRMSVWVDGWHCYTGSLKLKLLPLILQWCFYVVCVGGVQGHMLSLKTASEFAFSDWWRSTRESKSKGTTWYVLVKCVKFYIFWL